MIFCARGTRTIRMCSSDARSGRSFSPHPLEKKMSEMGEIICSLARWAQLDHLRLPFPEREASELVWIISMGDGCAMRAVEGSLYHSSFR